MKRYCNVYLKLLFVIADDGCCSIFKDKLEMYLVHRLLTCEVLKELILLYVIVHDFIMLNCVKSSSYFFCMLLKYFLLILFYLLFNSCLGRGIGVRKRVSILFFIYWGWIFCSWLKYCGLISAGQADHIYYFIICPFSHVN